MYRETMKNDDVIASLAALAQDSRLAIYRLLVKRGPEGHAAGEISDRLKIAGPSLSFHLKELAHAGLVTARKDGRFIYYSANFDRMNQLVGYLTENCCSQGTVCAPACASNTTIERKRKSA
jgi:ArsR family transcriptional regulator